MTEPTSEERYRDMCRGLAAVLITMPEWRSTALAGLTVTEHVLLESLLETIDELLLDRVADSVHEDLKHKAEVSLFTTGIEYGWGESLHQASEPDAIHGPVTGPEPDELQGQGDRRKNETSSTDVHRSGAPTQGDIP